MKKNIYFIVLCFFVGLSTSSSATDILKISSETTNVQDEFFVIQNFENLTVGSSLVTNNSSNCTAVVANDPVTTNENKVGHIVTSDYHRYFRFVTTLPAGKTIADYSEISFDLWFKAAQSGSIANNFKEIHVFFDNVRHIATNGQVSHGPHSTWLPKAFPLTGLSSGNSVTIDLGIFTDLGDYFIDNVRLKQNNVSTSNFELNSNIFDLSTKAGKIVVSSIERTNVFIYNAAGQLVVSSVIDGRTEFPLSNGLYIVQCNGIVKKCVVR